MKFQGHSVGSGVIIGIRQRGDSRIIGEPDGQGNGLPEMGSLAQPLRGLDWLKFALNNDSFGVCRTLRGLFPEDGI
jgi:hypothetical protein